MHRSSAGGASAPASAPHNAQYPPVMEGDPAILANPDGRSPYLLMCDHASNALPAAYGSLGLPGDIFAEHVAWDIGAKDVTLRLAEQLDATAILGNFSRLLIDPNRHPDQPGLVPEETDGISIPGNQGLDAAEHARRLAQFHRPFHDLIDAQIALRQEQGQNPAVIGIHSFTPVMQDVPRPWQIALLWNRDPRVAQPLIDWLRRDADLMVGDNEPYSGKILGHSMNAHGGDLGLANSVIEIRQNLVDTPETAYAWADRVADGLLEIAADPSIFKVTHY